MADSIREKGVKNLHATLEGITVANGYTNTIRSVQRFCQTGQLTAEKPYIILSEGDETVESPSTEKVTKRLQIALEVVTAQDVEIDPKSSDEVANSLRADIQRAVEVDFSRGGNAIDTVEVGSGPIQPEEGQPEIGFVMLYEIQYRHQRGDPFTM